MANHKDLIDQISYDKNTGIFIRKKSCRGYKAGRVLGSKTKNGYLVISFQKKTYYAHRLAWFYVYKEFPSNLIDHINRVKDDNRIDNLRVVSSSQNLQNSKMHKDNKSGFKGVWWHKKDKIWRSQLFVKGKKIYLGSYKTALEASKAYIEASKTYQTHGIFKDA